MTGERYLRQVPLLPGESIEQLFIPEHGLVTIPTDKGELLGLTNHRVIFFSQEEGNHRVTIAALGEVKGATLRNQRRNIKYLYNGLAVAVAGILAYFIVGTFIAGVVVAALVGGALLAVGVFLAMRYLLWDEEGSIVFHSGGWDLTFHYHSQKASRDADALLGNL